MTTSPIARAVEAAGGPAKLARELGVSASLVSQWASGHRPVAARHVLLIERACAGAVTRHDLAPEVFGPSPGDKQEAA